MTIPANAEPNKMNIHSPAPNVYFVEDNSVPLLSLSIIVPGGAATDPEDKAGLARIMMAMLDEGAGDMNALTFQQKLEDYGVQLDFSTSRDILSIELQTLVENKAQAAELLIAALTKPKFDQEALERIKRQTLSQIAYKAQTPSQQASELWWQTAFEGHPYAQPVEGTAESIAKIERADLQNFFKQRITNNDLSIGIVGDLSESEAKAWLENILAELLKSEHSLSIPSTTLLTTKTVSKPWPGDDSVAMFGHKGIGRGDPDYYAAILLNHIFGGGGFDSRLMEEVREKRGLTYGVGTGLISAKATPLLIGRVTSAGDKIDLALNIIKDEWQKIAKEGVTKEELQYAKDHEIGSFYLQLDSTDKLADILAAMQYHNLSADYLDNREALLNDVTFEQANKVAQRLFDADNLITAIIGK